MKSAHRDRIGVAPGREQGRLVDQICQIRAGEARRQRRDLLGFDVGGELGLPQMNRQDLLAPRLSGRSTRIWRSKRPARSSAGSRISGPVGRAEQDETARRVEAVELGQELVQGLLLLVVPAADRRRRGRGRARRARR